MGWLLDAAPRCEGYLVAVDKADGLWEEITYQKMRPIVKKTPGVRYRVNTVQVACDCGWRSPRIAAPGGTEWSPYIVTTTKLFEERARDIWLRHAVPHNEKANVR